MCDIQSSHSYIVRKVCELAKTLVLINEASVISCRGFLFL